MGADYDSRRIKDKEHKMTECAIHTLIVETCEESAYQNGHGGYSGTFAEKDGNDVDFLQKEFDSVEEADTHIDETADKWGSVMVAKVKDYGWVIGAVCSS